MGKNQNLLEKKKYRITVIVAALVATIMVILYSLTMGTIKVPISEIVNLFRGYESDDLTKTIILNVRMPRILTGLLVGMNLAVAGVLLQGTLRNPMASPNVIGVNAGAGLGAIMTMILFPSNIELIPVTAFAGALIASLLVYGFSIYAKRPSTAHIILIGVALSALFRAFTSGLMTMNSDELAVSYSWLLGNLSGRSWTYFEMIYPYTLLGLAAAVFLSPKINLFGLGDEVSSSIGLSVNLYRVIIIFVASLLAGSAISVAGTIGFIGLIAPHTARLFIGNDYKYLVPLSALFGGFLLILSDTVARTIFQPVELSVGIITSALGAPFFLYILYRKGQKKIM